METSKTTVSSNYIPLFENEQHEKMNLEEVIEFSPITDELMEYVVEPVEDLQNPDDESKNLPMFKRIDQQKLIILVRNREAIWNWGLPPEKKSRARRDFAWLDIKKAFNDEFELFDLRLKWKRLKDRYIKFSARHTIPEKIKDAYGVESIVTQDIHENDFMKSMSFLSSIGETEATNESTENVSDAPIFRDEYMEDGLKTIDSRKLVQLVKKHESVWDSTLPPDERSLLVRKNAWSSIKQELNHEFTIEEIKLRWKRVKDRYYLKRKLYANPDREVDGFEREFLNLMSFIDRNDVIKKDHQRAPNDVPFPIFYPGKIDERELVKLVRTKEVIWNYDLKPDERSIPYRHVAWLEIKRHLNFDCNELKLVWKRLKERYFKYLCKKRLQTETHGSSSTAETDEQVFENDFIEAMSFVNRQTKPFLTSNDDVDDSCEKTEQKKRPTRIRKRPTRINQILLPETNPLDMYGVESIVTQDIQDNDLMKSTSFLSSVGETEATNESTENVSEAPIFRDENIEDGLKTINSRKLVKLVKKHKSIWDSTLPPDERSLPVRRSAWSSIKREFNHEFTVEEIKLRWKRVKDRYFLTKKLCANPDKRVDAFERELLNLMSFVDHNDVNKKDHQTAPNDEVPLPIFYPGNINERELVKLVRTKEVIWNYDLKPEERSSPYRHVAWLEIKRHLNFECIDLKLVWKRLKGRYFKYLCKKRLQSEAHGSSSAAATDEQVFENDFIEAMSFVSRQTNPFSASDSDLEDSSEKTEQKKRPTRIRKQPINQVFLPETNPLDVEMEDSLLPIKIEIDDDLNLTTDIEMVNVNVKMEELETTCRACLHTYAAEEMQMFYLNYTYIDDIKLGQLYKDYIGYKNPDKESLLPTSVCADCRRDLLRFHDFRNKCRSNESKYLGAVRCSESNEMSEEIQDEPVKFDVEEMVDHNYTATSDLYLGLNKNDALHFDGKKNVTEQSIDQQQLSSADEEDQDDKSKEQKPNPYKCGKCGKTYSKRKAFWAHLRQTHKLSNDSVAKIRTELEKSEIFKLKEPPKPTPPLSICPICGKSVKWITIHMKTHEEIRVKCTLCDRNYKSKELLNYHMKMNHKGVKYTCHYCPKIYSSWSGRLVHIHLKHYKEKPELQCEICKKCFPSTFTLKRHRRCHNKKKSFQCDLCSQVCASATVLRNHKEALHQNTTWPCDQCEATFKSKKQLQQHIEKHLGEKNYECPVCSQAFAQNVVMRAHVEKLHPGYVLPPKGTVLHKKALEQIAMQREIEQQYVKIDFVERKN